MQCSLLLINYASSELVVFLYTDIMVWTCPSHWQGNQFRNTDLSLPCRKWTQSAANT